MTGPCHKGPVENQEISTAAQAIQITASEPVNFTVYLRERMERMLGFSQRRQFLPVRDHIARPDAVSGLLRAPHKRAIIARRPLLSASVVFADFPAHLAIAENDAKENEAILRRSADFQPSVVFWLAHGSALVHVREGHAQGVGVEVEKRVGFGSFVRVHRAQAHDLLERGHVKSVALRLGIDFLLVVVEGFDFLFDALDALDKGAELVGCYAVFNGHLRLDHLAASGEFIGGAHAHCLLVARDVAAARISAIGQARTVDVEKQPAFVAQANAVGFVLCRDAEQLVCGRDRRVGNVEHYADSLASHSAQSFGFTAPFVTFSILRISRREGVLSPLTYRLTATWVTPMRDANSVCEMPLVSRYCASFIPVPYQIGMSGQYQIGFC